MVLVRVVVVVVVLVVFVLWSFCSLSLPSGICFLRVYVWGVLDACVPNKLDIQV